MTENASAVQVIWTWSSLLQIAFTTGLCTAVFNQAFGWIRETILLRQKNRIDGTTFALELVELLTAYAQECSSRIVANLYDDRSGEYGRHLRMPALKAFPDGPWGLLPSTLAAGIKDLRNEIEEAARDIEGTTEVDGHPDGIIVATSRYGTVGYTALLLARRLRRRYRLGSYQAAGQSNFERQLRKHYRDSHPNWVKRLWSSLPAHRLRRALIRLKSRIIR